MQLVRGRLMGNWLSEIERRISKSKHKISKEWVIEKLILIACILFVVYVVWNGYNNSVNKKLIKEVSQDKFI